MNILIVNTSEAAGGAAVAASRLTTALINHGEKAKMLVRDKAEDNRPQSLRPSTVQCGNRLFNLRHFLWERLVIFLHMRLKYNRIFLVDIANSGIDITRLREFKEADVIHLHWVNQGMLSLRGIQKILKSGKPVVWTMHDIWPATAICHLTLDCRRFTTACHHCFYLPGGGSTHDLAARTWRRKERLLRKGNIRFVACSRWLEGEAKASALLKGQSVTSIPNPIDTHTFCPGDRQAARQAAGLPQEGLLMLFVCQRVTNPNKGMSYLVEACQKLAANHPELVQKLKLIVLGKDGDEVTGQLPFEALPMGYVSEEQRMVDIYRAANVFILPSLSENLPNTIMEAMACGTPCVGFKVGGIPEEIDHKRNGYVAAYRDSDDLARGIYWTLCEANPQQLSDEAVRKVARNYSPTSVALRYSELYQEAIAQKHFKL